MHNCDVIGTAELLIAQFGGEAAVEAAMRSDRMRDRGDIKSAAVWRRIVRAIIRIETIEGPTKH